MTIEKKLQNLKNKVFTPEYNEETKKQLIEIEKKIREAEVKESLSKQDGIQMLLKYIIGLTYRINHALLTNEELTDEDRILLFARRRWNREFLNFFKGAEIELKNLELWIDEELAEINEDQFDSLSY